LVVGEIEVHRRPQVENLEAALTASRVVGAAEIALRPLEPAQSTSHFILSHTLQRARKCSLRGHSGERKRTFDFCRSGNRPLAAFGCAMSHARSAVKRRQYCARRRDFVEPGPLDDRRTQSPTFLTPLFVPVAYTLMSEGYFAFNRLRRRIPFLARR
jgi:hypothetical protein